MPTPPAFETRSDAPLEFAPSPDRKPPAETEVVVIGGGVAGVSAALTLAEWGVPVVLCEKGKIAAEQSSRNWGYIRTLLRDFHELPLMLESQALWRRWGDRVGRESIGLRETPIAYAATDAKGLGQYEDWIEKARPYQTGARILGPAEADAYLGQRDRRFVGLALSPNDLQAEPALAVPGLARLAAEMGAQVFESTAVRTLERSAGRVTGVVTEHGPIRCRSVILAAGAWARPFLENMGLAFPQLAVISNVQSTEPIPGLALPGPVGSPKASIRPRADGGVTMARSGAAQLDLIPAAFRHFWAFTPMIRENWRIIRIRAGRSFFGPMGRHRWGADEVSPFETTRVLDPAVNHALLDDVLRSAGEIHPQLRGARAARRWAGLIDVMPDELPVFGPIAGIEGLTLTTGLSGHGFGLGAGAGLLAAQMATGRETVIDPTPLSVKRF